MSEQNKGEDNNIIHPDNISVDDNVKLEKLDEEPAVVSHDPESAIDSSAPASINNLEPVSVPVVPISPITSVVNTESVEVSTDPFEADVQSIMEIEETVDTPISATAQPEITETLELPTPIVAPVLANETVISDNQNAVVSPIKFTPAQQPSVRYVADIVSDDDYTNDYSEVSTKRRRKDTRGYSSSSMSSPVLIGQYVIQENTCAWDGKWGMGSNNEIEGISSDFRYVLELPTGSPIPSGPQSGIYNGYFWMKVTPPKRVPENGLNLEFTQEGSIYRVSGHGENKFGAFSVVGTYNPETMEMICSKVYDTQSRSSRHKPSRMEESPKYVEREYRPSPRQATPSFLRESVNVPPGLNEDMKLCYKSLKRLMNHKWAGPFSTPVDPVALNIPDYFDIVKEPMDLGTVQRRIEEKIIVTRDEFAACVRRVFDNAFLYNKPQDDVHVMAKALLEVFERDFMQITRRIFESEPEPSSPVYSNKLVKRSSSVSKMKSRSNKNKSGKNVKPKRVMAPVSRAGVLEDKYEDMVSTVMMLQNRVKDMEAKLKGMKNDEGEAVEDARPMTVEEKKMLSQDINKLSGDSLHHIVNIIEDSLPLDRQGSEIEIDLDTLPNETLRKLQDYIRQYEANESLSSHKVRGNFGVPVKNPLQDLAEHYDGYNSDSDNSVNQDFY